MVSHFIEHRRQQQALAAGELVQPRAVEQGVQKMGIEKRVPGEWVDEKKQVRMEDLGMGVDRVRRESVHCLAMWRL